MCPHWSDEVRDKIHAKETERWRSDCAKNRKLEEDVLVKNELRREEYLGYGDAAVRRIFTKARTGAVELRLETGRWESLLLIGGWEATAVAKTVPDVQAVRGRSRRSASLAVCLPCLQC